MSKILFWSETDAQSFRETSRMLHSVGMSLQNISVLTEFSLHLCDLLIVDVSMLTMNDKSIAYILRYVQSSGQVLLLGVSTQESVVHSLQAMTSISIAHITPHTELAIQIPAGDKLTDRIDSEFYVHGMAMLFTGEAATVLATASWQYATYPVIALQKKGNGSIALIGLSTESLNAKPLQQLIFRVVQQQLGWQVGKEIGVAMLGYGAIGFEHGSAIAETPGLRYEMICDRSEERLQLAQKTFPHVRLSSKFEEVLKDENVDVVIIGTPPNTHASFAMQALAAGKHVVVEKPFCMTTSEADDMITLAQRQNRMLTVYQNRRWDPDFRAIRQIIDSGSIGDVFHVETFIGGFSHPCNYWHSHEEISGGVFYDWGSHYLDWILQLLPDAAVDVRATTQKRVWHDVTNTDQASLMLRFAGGQDALFIHSDIAAFLKPKWYILGTRGAITGTWRHESIKTRKWNGDLIEDRLASSEVLPEITVALYEMGGRIHQQKIDLPPFLQAPFHRNMADHILWGEPLAVDPASSRRNIAVMEAAVHSSQHNAVVVPITREHRYIQNS